MLQSQLFPKTRKEAPKDAESVNHKLLVRAGFIDQLMAGSWTLLPLGWRVVVKINQIIREEMNAIGGQEMLMPLLHPSSVWKETGRWEKAKEIMYQFEMNGKEYGLAFTHEEIVLDLLRKNIKSYSDLPLAVYHFSTKFRDEARPKSGILRGREFMMKDLYSAHVSEEDLMDYYDIVKGAYVKIFDRLGFNYKVTEASGGVFTDKHTHEFQVLCPNGEDFIYYCDKCDWSYNKEIFEGKAGDACPVCGKGKVVEAKAIEVGNIFPLGTWLSERMKIYYTDKEGKKRIVWFGSYGIGPTRVMGTIAEVSRDEHGLIWPSQVAPFNVHLIELPGSKNTKEIYKHLIDGGVDVLWDDRGVGTGEKFADCDLIGIPVRLVVSEKTGDKIEWKERTSNETVLLTIEEVLQKLRA